MRLADSTIAVTGATGFLGGYLVRALRAQGARVIAVVRNADKARALLPQDVELRIADLADRAALTRAFAGVDAVIANAAVISFFNPRLTMRTNVDGTRNVFGAMADAGVKRAIAISSSEVYGRPNGAHGEERALLERTPTWFLNAYGVSKAEAERVAWREAEAAGITLTIFRPCGITGPRDPLLIAYLERFLKPWLVPFPTHTEIGVVHAADVADAVVLALCDPEVSGGKAYNLQGNTATLWQLADAWRRAGGHAPKLRLPIPVPVSLRHDDTRARRELGWQPRGVDAIMREAVAARG
ncbi:MAG TPA: NAD(P)-dependent oxidoreductase [Polyangiales bacterium]